jgi:hypothetical protein
VRELECDGEGVFVLALVPCSRRPLLALEFLRTEYEDADREDE